MAEITAVDSYLRLKGCVDNGTSMTWIAESASSHAGAIHDINGNGLLDPGTDFYANSNNTFTGYLLSIGGREYGIFHNGNFDSVCYVPYSKAELELAAFLPLTERSTALQVGSTQSVTSFCFVSGTAIATPGGEKPVEDMATGDLVRTVDGRSVPVLWVGRQRVSARAVNMGLPEHRLPVRIMAGALGNHCDLFVSADHGLLIDGMMINAAALVNGHTVDFATQADVGRDFTYWHIETEAHENILANDIAAETFIDAAGRAAFDNHNEYQALYGHRRAIREQDRPRITCARLLPTSVSRRLCFEGLAERVA